MNRQAIQVAVSAIALIAMFLVGVQVGIVLCVSKEVQSAQIETDLSPSTLKKRAPIIFEDKPEGRLITSWTGKEK